jgi:ribosomal-protein-alanine N-acetyltransferase
VTYSLRGLSRSELEELAASRVPRGLAPRVEPGALPPAFVAARSLQLAAEAKPEPWSTTFLIVREGDGRIVGGCGFKTAPSNGRVEVGYGVAPDARGRGAASSALQLLLQKAFAAGASEVLAEVSPTNHASTRVVRKAGFREAGTRVDEDDEFVVQWLKRSAD